MLVISANDGIGILGFIGNFYHSMGVCGLGKLLHLYILGSKGRKQPFMHPKVFNIK